MEVVISMVVLAIFMIVMYFLKYGLNYFKLTHYDSYFYSFLVFIGLFYIFALLLYISPFRSFLILQCLFWLFCLMIILCFFYFFSSKVKTRAYIHHVLNRIIYCGISVTLAIIFVYVIFSYKLKDMYTPILLFVIMAVFMTTIICYYYHKKYGIKTFKYSHSNFILGLSIYTGIFLAAFSVYGGLDYLTMKDLLYPSYSNNFNIEHNYLNIYAILASPGDIDTYTFMMTFGKFIEGFFFIQAIDYMSHYLDKKNHKAILILWLCSIFIYINMFTFNTYNHLESGLLKSGPSYFFLQFNIFFPMLVVMATKKADIFKSIFLLLVALSIDMFSVYIYFAYLIIISFVEIRSSDKKSSYQVMMLALILALIICMLNHTIFVPYPVMFYQAIGLIVFVMVILSIIYYYINIKYILLLQEGFILLAVAYQLLYSYPITVIKALFIQKTIFLYWIEKPWLKFSYPLVEHVVTFISNDILAIFFIVVGLYGLYKDKRENTKRLFRYVVLVSILIANPFMYNIVGNLYIVNAKFGYLVYTRVFMISGIGLCAIYGAVYIYNNYIKYHKKAVKITMLVFILYSKVYLIWNSQLLINPDIKKYDYIKDSVKAFKIQDQNVYDLMDYPFLSGDKILFVDNIINPYFERFWIDSTSIGKLDDVVYYKDSEQINYDTYIVLEKYPNNFQLDANNLLITNEKKTLDSSYNYYLRKIDQKMLAKYSNLYYEKGVDFYNSGGLLEDVKGGLNTNDTPIN